MGSMKLKQMLIIAVLSTGMVAYNNCGDVEFRIDEEAIQSSLSKSASIVINSGDAYTNSSNVILSINSTKADEMMITNDLSVRTSWEPYKTLKNWKLDRLNAEAKVYVMFRSRGIESPMFNDAIIHDDIKPVVTPKVASGQYTNSQNFTVKYNVADQGSGIGQAVCAEYDINGKYVDCVDDSRALISKNLKRVKDGVYQHFAYAVDKAGNKSDIKNISWTVDMTAPTVSFVGALPQLTPLNNVSINFTGNDASSGVSHYLCNFNNEGFKNCTSPISRGSLVDGNYSLQVKSIDNAGNSSVVIKHDWEVHTSAPIISFIQPLPLGLSKSNSAQLGFVGKDKQFNMTDFQCSLNGSSFQPCSSVHSVSNLSDGAQTLQVKAKDRLGVYSAPFSYSWTVDTTISDIHFVKKAKALSNESTAYFEIGNLDGDVLNVHCNLDKQGYKACPAKNVFRFADLGDGSHSLSVMAIDKAGNQSNTINHNFVIDTVAPVVTTQGPANLSLAQSVDRFTITANDNLTPAGDLIYYCKIDAGTFELCGPVYEKSLASGVEHSFVAKVVDAVGNETITAPYIYKTIQSNLKISFVKTPGDVSFPETKIEFKFNVTNDGFPITSTTCALRTVGKSQATVPCQSGQLVNLGLLALGKYEFIVSAESGSIESTSAQHLFEVQKSGACTGSEVCLALRDSFERASIREGDFGWSSFLIDQWSSRNIDISTQALGEASNGKRSAFFTGRPGGSVHALHLISKEFDFSGYSKMKIEFDYIMASFEDWSYLGDSGKEHMRVEICTLGAYECGVLDGNKGELSKIKDPNRWKVLYMDEATTPVNQHLDGRNHVFADFTRVRDDNGLIVNLNDTNLVVDKKKVIMRWTFQVDEGLVAIPGATPDAGIIDDIVVKAYKN